jgi:3alpha(or 20beta)-hydroxysteroid dehydrogenase
MGRLDGRVALVSGAARGLGEAVARLFVEQGARVVLGDVLHDAGRKVAAELGAAARYSPLDVRSEPDWAAAVGVATRELGGLDVLVNNAAILEFKSILDTTPEDYRRIIEVNQLGCFLGMRAVAPTMIAQRRGSIVNISSSQGLVGANHLAAYCSSKFAVTGMTKVAALEWGPHGIRVNSVHPAGIQTWMTSPEATRGLPRGAGGGSWRAPLKAACTPREVAQMVLFLASDEASHSTGSEFLCDGGWLAGPTLG